MPLGTRGLHLAKLVEAHGIESVQGTLIEGIQSGELKPADFSLKELAIGLCGREWVDRLEQPRGGIHLIEANPGGVDSTAFQNITGQIIYTATMDGYNTPGFIGDQLARTIPTPFHDGERIPGVTMPRGRSQVVNETEAYPEMGIREDYIDTPATTKNGLIVSISKETISKDRTGLVLDRASQVGNRVRYFREEKILDVVLGLSNTFSWKGTTYNTYGTSGNWINDAASTELLDWTQLEAMMLQLMEIANPDQPDATEPLPIVPDTLLVMPFKWGTANRLLSATQVREGTNTNARQTYTDGTGMPIPIKAPLVSQIAYQRLMASTSVGGGGLTATQAKHYFYFGEPKKAFAYMEVWPITVVQSAQNAEKEFEQDIVARFKASEKGQAAVINPRYMARRTNT